MPSWKSIGSFLSKHRSKGPLERRGGDFRAYSQADGDILTLLGLFKTRRGSPLKAVACIPEWSLRGIRAGIYVTGTSDQKNIKLHMPPWKREVEKCRQAGKTFVILNFGLYIGSYVQHAGAVLIDLRRNVIERFEPAGRLSGTYDTLDMAIEEQFRNRMPTYDYVGTIRAAPKRGPQELADAFSGLCVTFSLLYILVRLMNPQRTPKEVQEHLVKLTPTTLRDTALRLNRTMADTLRRHPRGSLSSHVR